MNISLIKVCSFFGHSKIEITEELKEKLKISIIDLIENNEFGIFCFGGFGEFDNLCWQIVTELKNIYILLSKEYIVYLTQDIKEYQKDQNG